MATIIDTDGNTKVAESIAATGGKTSRAARRRSAKRANAVKANSALADKMSDGDLSGEHVDLLADAAEKTDGASLTDETLIGEVAAVDPDKAKSVIDDFVAKSSSSGKEQTRHDRQRRKRRVSRFRTKDGCDAIMFAGDRETIDEIWSKVTRQSNALYRHDGGRDLPFGRHPRSHDQRMFDAGASFFTSGAPTADTKRDENIGLDGDPASERAPALSKRYTPKLTTSRPLVVITLTLEKLLGLDHDQVAQVIGSGPITPCHGLQLAEARPISTNSSSCAKAVTDGYTTTSKLCIETATPANGNFVPHSPTSSLPINRRVPTTVKRHC